MAAVNDYRNRIIHKDVGEPLLDEEELSHFEATIKLLRKAYS
jgi:hypothetical protein